jgi:hypothetical protein
MGSFYKQGCKVKMKWIRVKRILPPLSTGHKVPFVLAYHTIFGIGTAWFYRAEDDDVEEWKEEGLEYICSCDFIKSTERDGGLPDVEEFIDIFACSPHCKNIGTVTHWMELPSIPLIF